MEHLAYSVMYDAREGATADTDFNLPEFKFNWKKVRSSAWLGFAGFSFLAATIMSMQPASAATFIRTNGSCLRARYGPGTNYGVDRCISNGTRVRVVNSRAGFSQLRDGTWVASKYLSNRPGGTVNPGPGVGGPTTLEIGSRGQLVRRVQGALGVEQTGYYGLATYYAVRDYQASRGLDVTGVVGPQTRRAMIDEGLL